MLKCSKIFLYSILMVLMLGFSAGFSSCGGADDNEQAEEAAQAPANLSGLQKYYNDPLGYTPLNAVHKPIKGKNIPKGPRHHDRVHVNNIGRLYEVFNDSNKFQLEWAEKLGIEPINSLSEAYRTKRPLVHITDCDAYGVDKLTHSVPYLVPEAADLLKTIGYNFIDSLANRGVDGYKMKVTSLLRTKATVKSLKRVNKNATENSAHQYGTTFDISWSKFICADTTRTIDEGDLKNILAEVLEDLHKQKKCMVKFEKKTACFHITVTNP